MKFYPGYNFMVDKIQKALNKFSSNEKERVKGLLKMIKNGKISSMDIKKLKGQDNIYRVKKGKIRIIYKINGSEIFLLAIEKRSDNTYSNF